MSLVVSLEIKASLISAFENDSVRVAGNCVPANDNVAVGIDLSAVCLIHVLSPWFELIEREVASLG